MAGVCFDNRFEIIAKVKKHLIKATNIEMHLEELAQVDNILFRLWQCGYLKDTKELNKKLTQAEADYDKMFWQKNETISNLQEENAELKRRVDNQKSFLERIRKKFNLGELERKEIEGYLEGEQLNKAKELLKWFVWYFREGGPNLVPYKHKVEEAEQFIKDSEDNKC